jgi:hypothetical protein
VVSQAASSIEEPRATEAAASLFLIRFVGRVGPYLPGGSVHPEEPHILWPRVVILSVLFGLFEVWRVARRRSLWGVRIQLLWMMTAAFGAVVGHGLGLLRRVKPNIVNACSAMSEKTNGWRLNCKYHGDAK